MLKLSAAIGLGIALLCSIQTSYAQVPGGAEAGRVEERFEERTAPTVKPKVTRGLESTTPPSEAASVSLRLNGVTVKGSTVYSSNDLSVIYSDLIGKQVTLAQVFDIAAQITAKYGQDGYLLSRAIVPPQELDPAGASITIQIIEGYVDEVRWPEGVTSYRNFFDSYSAAITADRPLNNRTLERYLLLASDLPGLKFESNLVASETTPNASTLIITMTETRADGYVSIDNHGVEASGPYQATIGGGLNNTLRIHERIEGAFTAAGPSEDDDLELNYFAFSYEQVLTAEGLTFFINGNYSQGYPGTEALRALDYETEGLNISAGVSFPFIRTRSENLTGLIAFDFKNSESLNLGMMATEDRLRIIRGELDYEKADEFNGVTQLNLSASHGIEGLGSTENGNPMASRIPGVVDFFKVTGTLSRTQQLGNRNSLYLSGFAQWTDDPLLSSQECGYGGRTFGRGFDSSIITGDRCFLTTLEFRHDLPVSGTVLKYAQPYAFVDFGHITNIDAPLGTPDNDNGTSAGLGIRFGKGSFSADLAVTQIIDEPNSQTSLDDTRGWFKTAFRF